MEKTISISTSMSITNLIENRSVTNLTASLKLKFTEKVLAWDVTNDSARVDLVVKQFFVSNQHLAKELVEPGTRVTGTYILGVWFFKPFSGSLSQDAENLLSKIYVHPEYEVKDFGYLKFDQPRAVGESWNIESIPHIADALNEMGNSVGYSARKLLEQINTNNMTATARFMGLTNIAGFDCYDLRMRANISNKTTRFEYSGKIDGDLVMPLDTSQTFWTKNASVEIMMSLMDMENGTNMVHFRGKTSVEFAETCRGMPQS